MLNVSVFISETFIRLSLLHQRCFVEVRLHLQHSVGFVVQRHVNIWHFYPEHGLLKLNCISNVLLVSQSGIQFSIPLALTDYLITINIDIYMFDTLTPKMVCRSQNAMFWWSCSLRFSFSILCWTLPFLFQRLLHVWHFYPENGLQNAFGTVCMSRSLAFSFQFF